MESTETNTPAVLRESEIGLLTRFADWILRSWGMENHAYLQSLFSTAQFVTNAMSNCQQGIQENDAFYPHDEWCQDYSEECFFFSEFDHHAGYLKNIAHEIYHLMMEQLANRDAHLLYLALHPEELQQSSARHSTQIG